MVRHERSFSHYQQVLDLEHYLDVLESKPGALAGSSPLEQWRQREHSNRASVVRNRYSSEKGHSQAATILEPLRGSERVPLGDAQLNLGPKVKMRRSAQ